MSPRRIFALIAALALCGALAACSDEPAAPAGDSTASPPPSGPGAFTLSWDESAFGGDTCPATVSTTRPQAVCYSGTAKGELPVTGPVTLKRFVVAEVNAKSKPGCLTAVTDGTLTAPDGGVLTFKAEGSLCGTLASYAFTQSSGAGSLQGVTITGSIINSAGGSERWAGNIVKR